MNTLRPMAAVACCALLGCASPGGDSVQYRVRGDAIVEPLSIVPGDASRGRELVAGRDANCLLCHAVPETGERFMGNVAPALSGVGSRLGAGQLRLRVVDPTRVKSDVAMPAYYRTQGLDLVAHPYRGKPILTAQQVEDVVAYLVTLR